MRWRKVAILGVGLLGGSLGMALRRRRLAGEVVGWVRRETAAGESMQRGAVDRADQDLAAVVRGADLVVLCTPVGRMGEVAARLRDDLEPRAIVTDVGSVKGGVVEAVDSALAGTEAHFVGSHPMAGSEKMGVEAARDDLFVGATTVVTPSTRTALRAQDAVTGLWESLGSRVLTMSPERHDDVVGRSSHLPHLVATALARCVLAPGRRNEVGRLCASGFRDTTRVASGSPEMWRDIDLGNRRAILEALAEFEAELTGFRRVLESGDATALEGFLRKAKELRDAWRDGATFSDGE